MTYIIDLQRLWQDRNEISPSSLQIAPGAYVDPRHMTISVIMVVTKKNSKLSRKLTLLLKNPLVREIQLVNCDPSDGPLVNELVRQHPKCYILEAPSTTSTVEAYQMAARRASGHLLLFLDPQIALTNQGLMRLAATGLRKPHPWAVGLQAESLNLFHRQPKAPLRLPEVFMSGGGIHVPALSPTCLLIPTADYWELKGLDPSCRASTFHLDLCMRIHLAGGGVYQATDITSQTPEQQWVAPQQTWHQKWQGLQGRWRYYQKHFSKKTNFLFGLDKVWVGICLLKRLVWTSHQP